MARKASLSAASDGPLSWQQVQLAVVALGEPATAQQLEQLQTLLERFVQENEDPKASPHLRSTAPDRLDALAALLSRADVAELSPATQLAAVTTTKILCRRQDVRQRCTQRVVDALVALLDPASTPSGKLASEAANAVSNLCYEPSSCSMLLRTQGVARLLRLLSSSRAEEAHMNAAAALQTISFQTDGRAALLKTGAPATVLRCLASSSSSGNTGSGDASSGAAATNGKLQQRLVGALHNLSSCAEGVLALRQNGGIAAVARLLDSQHPGVAAAAAGAVQNMSLEALARQGIREQPGALAALATLLIGPDTQAAVCAAGALANLADMAAEGSMPEGGSGAQAGEAGSHNSRGGAAAHEALVQALAAALAGGAVYHSLGQGVWPEPLAAPTDWD